MTVAEWCVFGTLMLYLLTIAAVKWTGFRRFDNARPRDPGFYEDAIRTIKNNTASSSIRCNGPSRNSASSTATAKNGKASMPF